MYICIHSLSTTNLHPILGVFLWRLIQRCEENENTCVILGSKCVKGHCMKPFMVKGVFTRFNIFTKNLTWEINTEIHKKRKRVNISDAKKKPLVLIS